MLESRSLFLLTKERTEELAEEIPISSLEAGKPFSVKSNFILFGFPLKSRSILSSTDESY
jgi:hypothetical protein